MARLIDRTAVDAVSELQYTEAYKWWTIRNIYCVNVLNLLIWNHLLLQFVLSHWCNNSVMDQLDQNLLASYGGEPYQMLWKGLIKCHLFAHYFLSLLKTY